VSSYRFDPAALTSVQREQTDTHNIALEEKHMRLKTEVENLYRRAIAEFVVCDEFMAIELGRASRSDYDRFIANVVRTHLRSPQIVAFLYSVAPPQAVRNLMHNLLEELGVDEGAEASHPSLLRKLAYGAGLAESLPALKAAASVDIHQVVVEPLLYPSLKETGLAAMVEVGAFEYMLSRLASTIGRALVTHRKLPLETVKWFTCHSEVDIKHAEQGLENLEHYAAYYDLAEEEAVTIAEIAMRENVYIKRYFGEGALERQAGRVLQ